MIVRENFRRYWKAGIFLTVVSSLINSLLNYVSSMFSSLPLQAIKAGPIEFTIFKQPEWNVMLFLFIVAVFAMLPWVYGRLIEVFHNKFMIEKKT